MSSTSRPNMSPTADAVTVGALTTAIALSSVSVGMYIDADRKNKQVQHNINNMTRLQLITALDAHEISKEDPHMQIKLFSKVSNGTKIMAAGGVALMGGAAIKHFAYDAKKEPAEDAKTIMGLEPVTFGIGVAGAGLTTAAVVKGTVEVVKTNKALKAAAETEALPEVADPTPAPAEA